MKRFYKTVTVEHGAILLDGRAMRTPAGATLVIPAPALAEAVAEEWRAQGETIDLGTLPLTSLANAAVDRAAPDPAAFAAPIAAYAETDLLCYRADAPAELKAAQSAAWEPLLDWARSRYDVHFAVTSGVLHIAQPSATIARLREALIARGPFALAPMAPLVTISGSLIVSLMLAERAIGARDAFDATHLDELWQAEKWGEDEWGLQAREARRAEFMAAARFLDFLDR